MVWLLRWIGFLVTVLRNALIGAAGASAGGGGGSSETTGIQATSNLTQASTTGQRGWEFQVGASDIDVTKLRIYSNDAVSDEELILWRISDQAELARETVTTVAGSWVEATLASAITLSSGSNYAICCVRSAFGSRSLNFNTFPGSQFTFASELSFVQYRHSGANDDFPVFTGTSISGITDIAFTV